MSRCGRMQHELLQNARSVWVHFRAASLIVHCAVVYSLQFQLPLLKSVRLLHRRHGWLDVRLGELTSGGRLDLFEA